MTEKQETTKTDCTLAFNWYEVDNVSHSSSLYDVQNKTYNCSSGSPELELRLQVVSSEQTQWQRPQEDQLTDQSFITTYHNGTYWGRVGDVYVDVTHFEGKLRECWSIESERTSLTTQKEHFIWWWFGKFKASHVQTWKVSSDDLLHRRDDSLPGPKVVLGDAVLPLCSMDGDVQGSQVGSRGRWQCPQLILLLLFLIH